MGPKRVTRSPMGTVDDLGRLLGTRLGPETCARLVGRHAFAGCVTLSRLGALHVSSGVHSCLHGAVRQKPQLAPSMPTDLGQIGPAAYVRGIRRADRLAPRLASAGGPAEKSLAPTAVMVRLGPSARRKGPCLLAVRRSVGELAEGAGAGAGASTAERCSVSHLRVGFGP